MYKLVFKNRTTITYILLCTCAHTFHTTACTKRSEGINEIIIISIIKVGIVVGQPYIIIIIVTIIIIIIVISIR